MASISQPSSRVGARSSSRRPQAGSRRSTVAGARATGSTMTKAPGWLRTMLDHPLTDMWVIASVVGLLVGIGLLMGLSASSVFAQASLLGPYYYAVRQVIFLVLSVPVALVLSRMGPGLLKVAGWVALIVALVMLMLVVATPLGQEVNGNRAWLNIGPIGLQPSEFAKVALILWMSTVLSMKERVLDQPRHLLFPLVPGALLVCGLVLLQRDLGTGMVMIGIMFAVLWVVGTPWVVLGSLGTLGLAIIGMLVVSSQNRMQRVMLFLRPPDASDVTVSQQPLSAVYALASGGWFGQGLGASKQKWGGLYDGAHNDYVFAVLGEEMGLLGTVGVIALFSLLGLFGFRIAMRSDTLFHRVLAGGITAWLLMQAMINIAVAMKLVPVLGVPLPFISVGGSALMANVIAAGLLIACARHEPAARQHRADVKAEKPRVTTVVQRARQSARSGAPGR